MKNLVSGDETSFKQAYLAVISHLGKLVQPSYILCTQFKPLALPGVNFELQDLTVVAISGVANMV